MKINSGKLFWIFLLAGCLLALCGCGKKKVVDEHEGQVFLYDGYDWVWFTPKEGAATNDIVKEDFVYENNEPHYVGSGYNVKKGIDVSEHQLEIDWAQVGLQNYDFAYIRAGRRGYTQGGIFEDEYFRKNYQGAKGCGLDLGVYFFSQAISISEAIEEANWVLDLVKDYPVSLPIVFDWEKQEASDSRTADIPGSTVTDCAVAFCETIKNAGYEPCVYLNRIPGYYTFDISRLQNYKIWFALPCNPPDIIHPSFYYRIDMWQYTADATVPGISVGTDVNYIFEKKAVPEE